MKDKHTSKRAKLTHYRSADLMKNPPCCATGYLIDQHNNPKECPHVLAEQRSNDLENELDSVGILLDEDVDDAEKYHLWLYRRCIAKMIGTTAAQKELDFTVKILLKDGKNFHAWSHRQWVLETLGGEWKDELEYCDKILEEDYFNTFAWNQRWFVIDRYHTMSGFCAAEMMRKEANFALQVIAVQPENESPWSHLRRICNNRMVFLFKSIDPEKCYGKVLLDEAERAKNLKVVAVNRGIEPRLYVGTLINRRGCEHALSLIVELICEHGYKPPYALREAIKCLFAELDWESDPSRCRIKSNFIASPYLHPPIPSYGN